MIVFDSNDFYSSNLPIGTYFYFLDEEKLNAIEK
jgi:hypothetical protein